MKIAVLSDIHSNLYALKMAIDNLKADNIDKIYFLGDYITDGENENEILHLVKNLADYAVLGNREKYMLDYSPAKKDYANYKTISTTYNNLSAESLEYIASLKEHYIIKIANYKILMIHGDGYYNDDDNIEDIFDRIIADFDFDICLFGHSHRFLYRRYKNRYFINPGSIGEPNDGPSYKYCILDLSADIEVVLKEFPIKDSFEEFADNYKKTAYFKNNYVWANMVLYMLRDGTDYISPFLKEFNDRIENLNDLNAEEFNKIWVETYEEFVQKHTFGTI